jgi:hypothetical protein
VEDLQRMASLCRRKQGGAEELKAAFNAYIRKRGAELVQDEARDKEMIDDLLAFKARCDTVLERALGRVDMFVHALKDGFEHALNVRQVFLRAWLALGSPAAWLLPGGSAAGRVWPRRTARLSPMPLPFCHTQPTEPAGGAPGQVRGRKAEGGEGHERGGGGDGAGPRHGALPLRWLQGRL